MEQNLVDFAHTAYERHKTALESLERVQSACNDAKGVVGDSVRLNGVSREIERAVSACNHVWVDEVLSYANEAYGYTCPIGSLRDIDNPDDLLHVLDEHQKGSSQTQADVDGLATARALGFGGSRIRVDMSVLMIESADFYSYYKDYWKRSYVADVTLARMKAFEGFMRDTLHDSFAFGIPFHRDVESGSLTKRKFATPGSMISSFTMFKNGVARIVFWDKDSMQRFLDALQGLAVNSDNFDSATRKVAKTDG